MIKKIMRFPTLAMVMAALVLFTAPGAYAGSISEDAAAFTDSLPDTEALDPKDQTEALVKLEKVNKGFRENALKAAAHRRESLHANAGLTSSPVVLFSDGVVLKGASRFGETTKSVLWTTDGNGNYKEVQTEKQDDVNLGKDVAFWDINKMLWAPLEEDGERFCGLYVGFVGQGRVWVNSLTHPRLKPTTEGRGYRIIQSVPCPKSLEKEWDKKMGRKCQEQQKKELEKGLRELLKKAKKIGLVTLEL